MVQIHTDDFAYLGSKMLIKIGIEQEKFIGADSFTLDVTFNSIKPGFVLDDFAASPITCSRQDITWTMKLPPVTTKEISPVVVVIKTTALGALFR